MNVFLVHADVSESSRILAIHDPRRARKQLVECCQLLASFDHLTLGSTSMRKLDGTPYKCAHPHHPLTKYLLVSAEQVKLTYDVGTGLSDFFPNHACSRSIAEWKFHVYGGGSRLLACRTGYQPHLCDSRREYAELLLAYMIEKKNLTITPATGFAHVDKPE